MIENLCLVITKRDIDVARMSLFYRVDPDGKSPKRLNPVWALLERRGFEPLTANTEGVSFMSDGELYEYRATAEFAHYIRRWWENCDVKPTTFELRRINHD